MASNYSKELADMLKQYLADISTDTTKLRQLLQETSVAGRYKLLREVNTTIFITSRNGIWQAARANHIITLKCMMDGFTSEQAATLDISSALRSGAYCGSKEAVEYLLALLNQDQRVEVLMKGDYYGNTALHEAIRNKHPNTAHLILASVEPSNQMKLLQIKNEKGQSVEDLPAYSLLTPIQGGLTYLQREFEKKLNKLGEANANQHKASAKEIAQLQTELTKQKEELAKQKEDTAEKERASAERISQLEAANEEQQRASAQEIVQLQTEMARQKRAFTQRINQQEEEIQRLVENFNRFEVYLRTPEVCDARGDQEIEDNQ